MKTKKSICDYNVLCKCKSTGVESIFFVVHSAYCTGILTIWGMGNICVGRIIQEVRGVYLHTEVQLGECFPVGCTLVATPNIWYTTQKAVPACDKASVNAGQVCMGLQGLCSDVGGHNYDQHQKGVAKWQ